MAAPMTPTLAKRPSDRNRNASKHAKRSKTDALRGAIYARYSKERDGVKLSDAKQVADCKAKAADNGHSISPANLYVDKGVSAEAKTRPQLERMLDDVRAGLIDVVYVAKIDRLTRSTAQFGKLWAILEEHDVQLVSLSEQWDTTTGPGKAMLGIVVVFANLELDTIKERNRGIARYRRDVNRVGGLAPYGYTKSVGTGVDAEGRACDEFVVNEEQAAVVRQLVRRVADGESLRGLARWLNDTGVPLPTHARKRTTQWGYTVVRQIVTAPAIAGWRENPDTPDAWKAAPWAAIVSTEDWQAARDALATGVNRKNWATKGPGRGEALNLLSGVMLCGRCLTPMAPMRQPNGKLRYRCTKARNPKACAAVSCLAADADAHVVAELFDALRGKRWSPQYLREDDRAAQLQRDIEAFAAAYEADTSGAFTAAQLLELTSTAKAKLAAIESEAKVDRRGSALARLMGTGGDAETMWNATGDDGRPAWPMATKRAIVREVFPSIVCLDNSGKGKRVPMAERIALD